MNATFVTSVFRGNETALYPCVARILVKFMEATSTNGLIQSRRATELLIRIPRDAVVHLGVWLNLTEQVSSV